jgi:hypothetical protein
MASFALNVVVFVSALLLPLSWGMAEAFDLFKGVMPGAVSRAHEKYEGDCLQCHTIGQKSFVEKCLACHKEVKGHIGQKKGFHGKIDASRCEMCHAEHNGRDVQLVVFDQAKFDHRQAEFTLVGKHQETACARCHLKPKYRETPRDCFSCHQQQDKHKGTLGKDCARCHTPNAWTEISFDHSTTKFPLEAKHRQVACDKCHTSPSFASAPTTCAGCHQKVDAHKGILGPQCERCHTAKSWKEAVFDHGKTDFALMGRHQQVACIKCHTTPRLKDTPNVCVTCHKRDDYHKGKLGTDCARCHTADAWKQIKFNHSTTKYPLIGKHEVVPCAKCHVQERYKLPTECATCHKKDDPHKGKLGDSCERCHVERGWKEIQKFDHSKASFALLGKHATVRCAQCHTTQLFKDASSQCNDCHTKDDYHKGNFGKQCDSCHTADSWKKVTFNHAKDTKFELTGKHLEVKCAKCHVKPLFVQKTPSQCADCHTKDDYHKGRFGKQCGSCHTTKEWKLDTFDHAKETGYALIGKHTDVKCEQCHVRPLFTGKTSRRCVTCHRKDDPHDGELGVRCELCHSEVGFKTIKRVSREGTTNALTHRFGAGGRRSGRQEGVDDGGAGGDAQLAANRFQIITNSFKADP